jgi:hypothetical protein
MERLLSQCNRLRDQLESKGRLEDYGTMKLRCS